MLRLKDYRISNHRNLMNQRNILLNCYNACKQAGNYQEHEYKMKEADSMTSAQEIDIVEPEKVEIDTKKLEELGAFIDGLETTEGALIEILHKAQSIFAYIPRDVQLYIARKLGIPAAEVFGVVSFYSFFTMKPGGKHTVSVCMGTACFVRGADQILEKIKEKLKVESNQTTEDGMFTLKDVRCVGACGLAPVVMVGDKVFGRVAENDIDHILQQYQEENKHGN